MFACPYFPHVSQSLPEDATGVLARDRRILPCQPATLRAFTAPTSSVPFK